MKVFDIVYYVVYKVRIKEETYMAKEIAKKSAETCMMIRMAYFIERKEFAELLGVNPYTIFMYEHGFRTPRVAIMKEYIDLAAKKKIKVTYKDFQD